MIIDDYGRCSAQACVKHHVYDWDFRFPIPNETVKQMDARFRDIGFVLAGGSLAFLDFETFLPKLYAPVICHCGEILHRHDRVKHCRVSRGSERRFFKPFGYICRNCKQTLKPGMKSSYYSAYSPLYLNNCLHLFANN